MRSELAFLAATLAVGCSIFFSAASAQVLPTVLHVMWLESTQLIYDPLLVATFILAATLAIGRTVDLIRGARHGDDTPRHRQRTREPVEPNPRPQQAGAGSAPPEKAPAPAFCMKPGDEP